MRRRTGRHAGITQQPNGLEQVRKRRANQDFGTLPRFQPIQQALDERCILGARAVHLPIARHERFTHCLNPQALY
jgi:hypothetical protein